MPTTTRSGPVIEHSARPAWAHLSGFAFDNAELRPEHIRWLEKRVVRPFWATPLKFGSGAWRIELTGFASQVGDPAYNKDLAKRRAQAIKMYLLARIDGTKCEFQVESMGEDMPFDEKIDDNSLDRSVQVWVALSKRGRRTVRMKIRDLPPPPVGTDQFTIQ